MDPSITPTHNPLTLWELYDMFAQHASHCGRGFVTTGFIESVDLVIARDGDTSEKRQIYNTLRKWCVNQRTAMGNPVLCYESAKQMLGIREGRPASNVMKALGAAAPFMVILLLITL